MCIRQPWNFTLRTLTIIANAFATTPRNLSTCHRFAERGFNDCSARLTTKRSVSLYLRKAIHCFTVWVHQPFVEQQQQKPAHHRARLRGSRDTMSFIYYLSLNNQEASYIKHNYYWFLFQSLLSKKKTFFQYILATLDFDQCAKCLSRASGTLSCDRDNTAKEAFDKRWTSSASPLEKKNYSAILVPLSTIYERWL